MATVTTVPNITPAPGATVTPKPLSREEAEAIGVLAALIFGIGIGIAAGVGLCFGLGEAAKAVYTAVDPKYYS